MNMIVECERESDGRWLADVLELPGVMAYGATLELAIEAALRIARRVVAEQEDSRAGAPDELR
ncbi:MAG TPA: hypothetical protein VNT33_03490 [Telluria sp.]|nr:hypothetical protein [Telluria sp.]